MSKGYLKVLIIDNHPKVVQLVQQELERGGYQIDCNCATSLSEFQQAVETRRYDVIISEYELPGFSVLDALQVKQSCAPEIPFLIFSDVNSEESIVSVLKNGASDFIFKEHPMRLLPSVERGLQEAETRRERIRAEKIRDALFKFSQSALAAQDLPQILQSVHATISELMPANNLFVALYDEQKNVLNFPYFVDEYDAPPPPKKPGRGLTEYVLRSGQPVLASPELFQELVERGEVELIGAPSIDWMGVPLKIGGKIYGVLAVQSYTEGVRYRQEDIEILAFASEQVSQAIERIQAEQALREEIAFRNVIETSILAGIFAFDLEGRQTYVNPAFCRMVGWSAEELIGARPPYVYWPEEEIERIFHAFRITTGEDALPSDFELRFRRKNGDRFDVYVLVAPLSDTSGKVSGWLASVYDITERKRAEEVIRRQRRRAEALASMAARLNARLDLETVVRTICEDTAQALNVTATGVVLYDPDREVFSLAGSYGLPAEFSQQFKPVPRSAPNNPYGNDLALTIIPNLQEHPDIPNAELYQGLGVNTLVAVRMEREQRILGSLCLFLISTDRRINDDDLTLLQGLADLAEQAIVNARLFEETERRLEQVHALRAIDQAISASLDLKVILNILLDHVISLLHADAADILLFNPSFQKLEFLVGRGFRGDVPVLSRIRPGESFAGRAVIERRTVMVADLNSAAEGTFGLSLVVGEGFISYVAAPLIAKGEIKGVLEIYLRSPLISNPEWLELLEAMAGQAAIAIDSASLFEQLQRSNEELKMAYDSTLEGWVRALDLRDRESEDHTRQVTEMTIRLAQKMGIKNEELIHIRRGALLHDVGKIGISDQILRKPEPLTEAEWEIVKQHPLYAHQILYPIVYLRPALEIPYCHHERWDGSGYPRGLKGEEIPLSARIFAVVDVWDSLRSSRPYRPAWPDDKVLQYIREQAGKHFDPKVVEVFLQMV